jgi:large subunit ribosomal protein L10
MRPEKNLLSDEVGRHLAKSSYVFLASYTRTTVADVTNLRNRLAKEKAEFHVVKNSALKAAAKKASYPELDTFLTGQTAIIVGGKNAAAVAKIIRDFFKETQKVEVKGGVLSKKVLKAADVTALADMPPLEVVQAQLLGLFKMPAQRFVSLLNNVPGGLLNVLQAKAKAS